MRLRDAGLGDTEAVAGFHLTVWRETYRDMAPPEAFRRLDLDWRLRQWAGWLARPLPHGVVLAEEDGIHGLVSFGPTDAPVFDGRAEIGHLYIAGHARRRGLGQRLLGVALERMRAAGLPGAGLAVVRENAAARGFYAAAGGREAARFTDPGPLWRSDNILIVWDFS